MAAAPISRGGGLLCAVATIVGHNGSVATQSDPVTEIYYRAEWIMHTGAHTSGLIVAESAEVVEERIRDTGGTPVSVVPAD